MGRMTLETGVSEDRQTAVLEMHEDGNPLAHMLVDASTLEAVIRQLAVLRSQMAEEVTPALDPMSRLEAVPQPAWLVPNQHSGPGGVLMALRHPGYGWLGFLLEKENAHALGKALQAAPTK